MLLLDIEKALKCLIPEKGCAPVVVFSSLWPFLRNVAYDKRKLPDVFIEMLLSLAGNQDLIMPTFANGYQGGVCNLDEEPSKTGLLSEVFRAGYGSRRSLSAFFSYSIAGPSTDEFVNLKPRYAWGDGSPYHWMEERNVIFLMIGVSPVHCSYSHRVEWLLRDKINYRYNKTFEGTLVREGEEIPMSETLYVRDLNPPVVNDYQPLYELFLNGGMNVIEIEGVQLAAMRAKAMRDAYFRALSDDPFLTVKNRSAYEEKI